MVKGSSRKDSEPSLKETVAANIRTVRESLGFTREALAAKAKVSARYIYMVERGDRNLSLDTLQALATALACSVCDLVCTPERPAETRRAALILANELLAEHIRKLKSRRPKSGSPR